MDIQHLNPDPIAQFADWLAEARQCPLIALAEAMCLSTIDNEGYPSGRMVLLKGFSEAGFVFYTNTESEKGQSLIKRPKAALTFYWEPLKRQVRLKGIAESVPESEADAYFCTRPRLSQISAWASRQSAPVGSRAELDERFADLVQRYEGQEIPRPPYWSGFCIFPITLEFWQERPNRMHDRFLYNRLTEHEWVIGRLSP